MPQHLKWGRRRMQHMEGKSKIISFEQEFSAVEESLFKTRKSADNTYVEIEETERDIDNIWKELSELGIRIPADESESVTVEEPLKNLDNTINDFSDVSLCGAIKLTEIDFLVGITAGIIASVIDIVFVGTPEVVKIYKGGENFDGSILTGILRKIGNGNDKFSEMLKWLSEKCKVPYDIPAKKGVVNPNNHRLRSFGHDPLIGLLFAVADIILGTATVVDNNGKLRVIVSGRKYPDSQKYLAVLYYLGHLLSDVCTARGLPIPGFITTQFFAGDDSSIARIAEQMYMDGYDLRHFAAMETPVLIKNMITDAYCRMCMPDDAKVMESIADRQIRENRKKAYKYKLRLISDAVSCGGNVLKFFIPPTMGNMTALNLPEWISLIRDTVIHTKYQMRDKNLEKIIADREIINENWKKLQSGGIF